MTDDELRAMADADEQALRSEFAPRLSGVECATTSTAVTSDWRALAERFATHLEAGLMPSRGPESEALWRGEAQRLLAEAWAALRATEAPGEQIKGFAVELEQEEDGRWIAEVLDLPGVLAYGATQAAALAACKALALRVLADRLDHGATAEAPA